MIYKTSKRGDVRHCDLCVFKPVLIPITRVSGLEGLVRLSNLPQALNESLTEHPQAADSIQMYLLAHKQNKCMLCGESNTYLIIPVSIWQQGHFL